MLRPLLPALLAATTLVAATASAQPVPAPPPTAPPETAPPVTMGETPKPPAQPAPTAPPPGYGPPPQPLPPEYAYAYAPPPPPPPPPPSKPLRWSLRYDPFDLVYRRLTFEAEVAVYKLFALEVVPSWIFGSPSSGVDEKGFAVAGRAVFYLSGEAFRGFWLKAHVGYENFSATVTNPSLSTDVSPSQQQGSAVLGVLFGDTWVIPRDGGFALSGGIGIGYATAPKATLSTPDGYSVTLYDGFDKVRLLGSVGLGVAF